MRASRSASSDRPATRRPRAGQASSRSRPALPTTGSRPSAADPSAPWVYVLVTRYGARQALQRQLPDALHRAPRELGRGRDLRPRQGPVRVQGLRPVRPDHRGRAGHGRRLRGVHERVQRPVHEVGRSRRHLVGAGQGLRERVLERQADPRREQQRHGRLRGVQRAHRRRPLGRPVAQRRRLVDADEGRRLEPLLLRLRRRRSARRHRVLLAERDPVRRRRATRARSRRSRSSSTSSSPATRARAGTTR